MPAALYNLVAPKDSIDAATGLPRGNGTRWYVVYIPYATEATSGFSTVRRRLGPAVAHGSRRALGPPHGDAEIVKLTTRSRLESPGSGRSAETFVLRA